MFIYLLYRLVGIVAAPLIVLYFLIRGLRDRRYWQRFSERLGSAPASLEATIPGGIWLHAVSVGEVIAAQELLKRLKLAFPRQQIFVSVSTLAGRAIAEERLKSVADAIFYPPLDYCWMVRRVFRRLQPQLLIVMETEIWPNLYREAKRFGCGLLVVNGRISDRAFPRYRRWRLFVRAVLAQPDAILVQNKVALERYIAVGAPPRKVRVTGNLKYDFQPAGVAPPEAVTTFCQNSKAQYIWIAASTMPPADAGDPDEEELVIQQYRILTTKKPRVLLILVPRRPERFDETASKLQKAGLRFFRRSQLKGTELLMGPGVLLVDTMGELSSLFPLADVVFMGGTLAHRGGHNILEPAFFGKPVIIGPHMENFPDIGEEFRAAGAVHSIPDGNRLADAVIELLDDGPRRTQIGAKAQELAEARRGATERAVAAALDVYRKSLPIRHPSLAAKLVFWPLQGLWRAGTWIDRTWKTKRRGRLRSRVISIGGISMGGTGKTPLVAYLAAKLAGQRTGILTRGYKRRQADKTVVLIPGQRASVAETGDEAQILLRRGDAAVGIGADRWAAARELEKRFQPDVVLLDDGYQHWKMFRDADLVLIDALDPLGRGAVFPLGRLREPLTGLVRASAFVVTRTDRPLPWEGLEQKLHEFRPRAPVFYASNVAVEWISANGEERYSATALPWKNTAAFCGLGNPASFWSTLAELGLKPILRRTFPDHHAYQVAEVQRLAELVRDAGVEVLLTTEKDAVNLPAELPAGLKLFWLRMDLRMEREAEFLAWVQRQLRK